MGIIKEERNLKLKNGEKFSLNIKMLRLYYKKVVWFSNEMHLYQIWMLLLKYKTVEKCSLYTMYSNLNRLNFLLLG